MKIKQFRALSQGDRRFYEKKRFEQALRRHCRVHGLDYFAEKREFEKWERTQKQITWFSWAALIFCLLILAGGR